MTGSFKSNLPYNSFLLFIYGLLLKWPIFTHPLIPASAADDTFLYKTIIHSISFTGNNFPLLYSIIVFLLLYIQAIGINTIINNQKLFPKPNYLTGMCFMLFTSLFTQWFVLSGVLISVTFLIFILSKLCKLPNDNNAKKSLFNIGLLLGLSTLFYFPSIVFLVLVLLGLAITRTFRLPEWVMVFLGLITPYYFLGAYDYIFDSTIRNIYPAFAVSLLHFTFTRYETIAIVFALVTFCIGFVFIQNNMRKLLVQSRKSWTIIYFLLIISFIVPFLNMKSGFLYWLPAVIPFSAIAAAAYLYPGRKWFSIVSHWGMIILSVIIGYFFVITK